MNIADFQRYVDGVRDFFRKLFGVKKKVTIDRIINEEEIRDIDKDLLSERGYKDMQLALKQLEINKLKEKKKDDEDVDIKKYLNKQKNALYD